MTKPQVQTFKFHPHHLKDILEGRESVEGNISNVYSTNRLPTRRKSSSVFSENPTQEYDFDQIISKVGMVSNTEDAEQNLDEI